MTETSIQSKGQGTKNNDPTLLSGLGATESHLMGFTVLAPPSTLADNIILAFNTAKAPAEILSELQFSALEDTNPAFLPAVEKAWASPTMEVVAGQGLLVFGWG